MDRLWTPWRYAYVTGKDHDPTGPRRKGVPEELAAWPGPDTGCVFCNLDRSTTWGAQQDNVGKDAADKAGLIVARLDTCYVCLNRYPYSSGHLMVVPYEHTDSLAQLPAPAAEEIMRAAQRAERVLRNIFRPDGINLGMNLGQAAGAGVAEHIHLHELPRWFGDTNFMTSTAETRVLPESLAVTWQRLTDGWLGQR